MAIPPSAARCESCNAYLRSDQTNPICDPCAPAGSGALLQVNGEWVRENPPNRITLDEVDSMRALMEDPP